MSFFSLSTKTRVEGGTKVVFGGLVELIKKSDEVEDAEVTLSVSKKDDDDDDEIEERELGLEVAGEITSGVEREGRECIHGNVHEELFTSRSRRDYGICGNHGEKLVGFLLVIRFELLSECAGISTSLR